MSTPLVSVIITFSGDYEKFSKQCFESVENQTYPKLEVLVGDNGCDPKITGMIPRGGKLNYYPKSKFNGPQTRNQLFVKAKGKYVVFLDGDDWLDPDYISNHVVPLEYDPSLSVCYSPVRYMKDDGVRPIEEYKRRQHVLYPDKFDPYFLWCQSYIQTTTVMKRSAFPGFDPDLPCYQDWDLYLRMEQMGHKFLQIPGPGLFWRDHKGSEEFKKSRAIPKWYTHVLMKNARYDVITSFAGKDYTLDDYIKALKSIEVDKWRVRLLWYDDSMSESFHKRLVQEASKLKGFADIKIVNDIVRPKHHSNMSTSHRMSRIYLRMKKLVESPFVLFWEDDVIPPKKAITKLMSHMKTSTGISAGYAKCRGSKLPLAWIADKETGNLSSLLPGGETVQEVDSCGMGFTLVREIALKMTEFRGNTEKNLGQDVVFGLDVGQKGMKVYVDWSVKCNHKDKTGWVTPSINVNIGCGTDYLTDYVNVDCSKSVHPDMLIDASGRIPFPTSTVDRIESRHFLEHLSYPIRDYKKKTIQLLQEWRRILKPGGKVIVETPDLKTIDKKSPERFYECGCGCGQSRKYAWTMALLMSCFVSAKFVNVFALPYKKHGDEKCIRLKAMKDKIDKSEWQIDKKPMMSKREGVLFQLGQCCQFYWPENG